MHLRNIIFDLDGTLIDSARLTATIIDQMLDDRGTTDRADPAVIRRMDAVGGEAMIAAALGQHSLDPAAEIEEFRGLHRTIAVPADLPFTGVAEALAALVAKGASLAICSNKPQALCDKILGELGLAPYFGAIIGSTPGRARKPAPDSARLAMAMIEGTAEDTLYCGDSAIDVATARAAGLPVVLVEWGYGTDEALRIEPFTPVLRSMSALVDGFEQRDHLGILPR